jgi:hypothetical protein
VFGREITKYTVIYGVYERFWPTLGMNPRIVQQTSRSATDTEDTNAGCAIKAASSRRLYVLILVVTDLELQIVHLLFKPDTYINTEWD